MRVWRSDLMLATTDQTEADNMGGLSIWHWIIVLAVVLLIFGTKRLRNVGQDLGEAIKGFKQGLREDDAAARVRDERDR